MSQRLRFVVQWGSCAAGAVALAVAFGIADGKSLSAQAQAGQAGGAREGIRVHGHWIIEVRNPDGRLVAHREFDNALTSAGAGNLAKMMSRVYVTGEWEVVLANQNSANNPCKNKAGSAGGCEILEHSEPNPNEINTIFFKGLTVSNPTGDALVLNGTLPAGKDGAIDLVFTGNRLCSGAAFTLASCAASSYGDVGTTDQAMTRAVLPTPVPVVAGQIIQVTVRISFS